ncbi:thiol-activated cytolysin family protein [Cellulophaga sp. L1A9]|uniref:thiol-activated cytolysin family protein n=1 Tax=Cellulophaga sp. L1A9 TaxID=2686362 RepID=UPI00131B1DCC|nr:thiol-activated cytolysin family protein [Cellulophaga sp. L1A9]
MKTYNNSFNNHLSNWHFGSILFFTCFLSVLFNASCSKEEESQTYPAMTNAAKLTAFNAEINTLSPFENPIVIDPPEEISSEPAEETGDYLCSTKRFKAAPEYNEMLLLDPTTSVIYPGALIRGESIATGEYIPIVASRKPISISVSLQNITGSPSRTVEDPKLSTIREAINDILSTEVTGATASKLSFEVSNVYSEEHLKGSIGANYNSTTVDVGSSFDFSSEKVESRVVVKYVQSYYTIDMDAVENPSDLFTELPEVASLGATLPSYVSTVTYGRMILFTATSSYSNTEMNAAFSAAFEAGISSGNVQIDASYQNIINNSSIKAFVMGGSGAEAVQAVTGIEGVKSFILSGGNYTKDSPGAPLSYTLRNISNNAISNIVLATEYSVQQCEKIRSRFKITLSDLNCSGVKGETDGIAEMFGSVTLLTQNEHESLLQGIINFGTYLWGPYDSGSYQTTSNFQLAINSSITVVLENPGPESYIYLLGVLKEYDPTIFDADEDLGSDSKKLFLADLLSGSATLNFNGDGDFATANFIIEALN